MGKKILTGEDALKAILKGVNLVAGATGKTLGPNGRNVVYERVGDNRPTSTRDGVTCMRQFDLADPFENMGAQMVRGVSEETVDSAGDGTTTAAILTQAIFAEGVKACTVGANPVALKRGIEKATLAVVESLKSMARPVTGDMVRQVATISANNDEFLGGLIASAMSKAGADGVVTVEISRSPESSLLIVDGLQFSTGFLHNGFVNRPEKNECVLENVSILLWDRKFTQIVPMLNLLAEIEKEGGSFLVIAEDVTDEALAILAGNALKGHRFCAVKTPGGPEHLHDIAALTGGTVITELTGVKVKDITAAHLGHCKRVVVKPGNTTIISDDGENTALTRRLNELRTQVTEAPDEGMRLRLQSRLARLSGGVAVIRVGAATELEMLERKDRIEDAMHATRAAISEGVLPGGGIALLRASRVLNSTDEDLEGTKIVQRACEAPIRTLAANSGKSPEYILERILSSADRTFGWNARTDEFTDLVQVGVLDPLRVVRVALESAASVAALMLITSTLVANDRN